MSCTHSTDEEAEVGGLSALKLPWVPNTLRITIKFLQALPFSVQHPPPQLILPTSRKPHCALFFQAPGSARSEMCFLSPALLW